MLLKAGCDREDIWIEDDVFRREIELADQNVVGAFADFSLALKSVGLPDLVKRHHHHGGAVASRNRCLVDEFLFALLHGDRVDHRLALNALQAGFDHHEFRGVHHDGDTRDIRFGGDEVEERHHRSFRIQQAFVHVDVDDLRAVLDLVAGDLQRSGIVAGLDQLAETRGARDVGAFADVDERDV